MRTFSITSTILLALGAGCGSSTHPPGQDSAAVDAAPRDTMHADTTADTDHARPPVDSSLDVPKADGAASSDSMNDAPPWVCPQIVGSVAGTVQTSKIGEASGIAASRKQTDTLWVHNDSGGAAEVYAITTAGVLRGAYRLPGIVPDDWEDIAIGPGPAPGVDYLYVGDIGDNSRNRAAIVVYRFPEPQLPGTPSATPVDVGPVEAITLVYPTTIVLPPPLPSFGGYNAESLFVDPISGDLFVVTKTGDGPELVYRSAAPHDTVTPRLLELVASFTVGTPQLPSAVDSCSAADISAGGDEIVVRTESTAFIWHRPPGSAVADAFSATPCAYDLLRETNGEAITFDAQKVLYTLSEGGAQPIHRYQR